MDRVKLKEIFFLLLNNKNKDVKLWSFAEWIYVKTLDDSKVYSAGQRSYIARKNNSTKLFFEIDTSNLKKNEEFLTFSGGSRHVKNFLIFIIFFFFFNFF